MENLISAFLLKHQYCPLPGIGTLLMVHECAQIKSDDQVLLAPKNNIVFQSTETDSEPFVQFISRRNTKNIESTRAELIAYCSSIKSINPQSTRQITSLGHFYVDESGSLFFKQDEIPDTFNPSIAIKRVIHPSTIHRIKVGDKEKGSDEMMEELKNNKKKKKNRVGLILFLLLLVLSALVFAGLWFAEDIELITGIEIPFRIRPFFEQ